jgi:TAP-like protein
LAHGNVTAAELEQAVWNLIDIVKYHPIALGDFMLDYTTLKSVIVTNLYSTFGWPQLTTLLDMLLTGNTEDALAALNNSIGTTEGSLQAVMSVMGIHCGDRTVRVASFDDFLPAIEQLYNTSKFMGDITPALSMTCAQWQMEAKGRYEGNFQVETNKPVLLIGNTYDGFTPLKSAYNVSSGFKGSVVLEVNGYGVRN